jgi:hypothetical protein
MGETNNINSKVLTPFAGQWKVGTLEESTVTIQTFFTQRQEIKFKKEIS